MSEILRTVSPIDGKVFVEREMASDAAIDEAVARAATAQSRWRRTPIEKRQEILRCAVDAFERDGPSIAEELTRQMGRPIIHTPGEIRGYTERARHMIEIAPDALADIDAAPLAGFRRFIRRDPLGLVFVLAPWNYPYLTAVNAVVPALLAGNGVIMKPSHQTPLSAERMAAAFAEAALPDGVFQYLYLGHGQAEALMRRPEVGFVAFTGSVEGGLAVQRALSGRFAGAGLELGGKDPAYVRADATLATTVENLVDGAFFNAGQSCCGIERIYVHKNIFDDFVYAYVEKVRGYKLGNPLETDTTMGPMARMSLATTVRAQIADAIAAGAHPHVDPADFPMDRGDSAYLAPQVLTGVDHDMAVMREESFGPVVGVMPVAGDDAALALMNDSNFGLTASIWTRDAEAALHLGERLETGTVFMNRCDYLDPALAWTGVKQSGRGCTLSRVGYEQLTRPKSYHLRLAG